MKVIIDRLRMLVKSSSRIIKLVNTYEKIRENSVDNAYVLERKLNEIEKVILELPDFELKKTLIEWVEKEKQNIEAFKEDFRFKFGKELTALFSKDGKKVRGQYPVLRIGVYTLRTDFQFGEAVLFFGPEIEKIKSKIPLQPEVIYGTISKFDSDIRAIKQTPEELIKDLRSAYERRLKLTGKSFGGKILITDMFNEFVMLKQSKKFLVDPQKTNFRGYSRVKLSYLLYYLRKSNVFEQGIRFHVATFDATVDKRHSIWILENEDGEGTHYSDISFEKIQNA